MRGIYRRGFIAIVFLALFFVAIFFILKKKRSDPKSVSTYSIVSQYMKPHPLPEGWNSSPSMTNKYAAFVSYSQKDYAEALINFKYSVVDNPSDLTQRFYLGVCLLITRESMESVREFNQIINNSDTDSLIKKAQWYKSLALVNLGRMDQAKRILSELDAEESKQLAKELADF